MTVGMLAWCLLAATAAAPAAAVSAAPAVAESSKDAFLSPCPPGLPCRPREDSKPTRDITDAVYHGNTAPGILDTINEIANRTDVTSRASLLDAISEIASRTDATKQALVDGAAEIATKPVQVLRLGMPVIAAKARIASDAFSQAMADSIQMLAEGDVSGALKAATIALARYQKTSEFIDAGTSVAAWRAVGILMVFLLIGLAWITEFLLTRRLVQRETNPEHEPDGKPAVRGPPFFNALSFTRFLFCWLVVADNFYNPGHRKSSEIGAFTNVARWGCLAYPWFFVVSGFSNSFSKMAGPKWSEQEDWFFAMVKRVSTWYPFYAMALTMCAVRSWTVTAEDWSHYLGNMLLINGLIWPEPSFPKAMVGQWLSFLMVYMTAWSPMYQVFHSCTNSVIWTMFTIACLVVIPSAIMEWYFFADAPLWMLIQYWPSFCFGQALATWFVRNCMQHKMRGQMESAWVMKPVHEIPLMVRFGPTFSFFVLGISFFCFSPYDMLPLIRKPVAPLILKGGLLPLMGIMVTGMACQVDPIAKLFARAPFRWAEKLCLMNFVLQVPVHNAIKDWTGWDGLTWTFSSSLLVATILGHAFLEQPWRAVLRAREK